MLPPVTKARGQKGQSTLPNSLLVPWLCHRWMPSWELLKEILKTQKTEERNRSCSPDKAETRACFQGGLCCSTSSDARNALGLPVLSPPSPCHPGGTFEDMGGWRGAGGAELLGSRHMLVRTLETMHVSCYPLLSGRAQKAGRQPMMSRAVSFSMVSVY